MTVANMTTNPAIDGVLLASSDIDPIATWGVPCCAVSFSGAGNISVKKLDGTDAVLSFASYPAGYRIDWQFAKIYASGTTATGVWVYTNRRK